MPRDFRITRGDSECINYYNPVYANVERNCKMKQNDKILSISIAAYQVESTIEKCLDSFLKSKYLKELELLVINDGSKDKTKEIVSRYEENYPGVIKLINKENGGHGSTINRSLSFATGKFYKVIDGDDWVDVEELDKLVEYLKITQADLVINRYREVFPTRTNVISKDDGYELNHVYNFSDLFIDNNVVKELFSMHSSTILTKRLREVNMQILEKCFYADVIYIYYVALSAKTVVFHDSCAYQYRLGLEGQSVSEEGIYKHAEDLIKIERKLIQLYEADRHAIKEKIRLDYIFDLLSSHHNFLLDCFTRVINCNYKDNLLMDFLDEINKKHKEIVSIIPLYRYNRIIVYNPKLFIPIIRCMRHSFILSKIKQVKNIAK